MSEIIFLVEEAPEGGYSARAVGEVLGVPGERHARLVDHTLVYRRRDHRIEFTAQTAVHCAVQQLEHVLGIRRVEAPSAAGRPQWHVQQLDRVPLTRRAPSSSRMRKPGTGDHP